MDDYKDLKEIIEKQAALNQKLAAMALELDSEKAKNAKLCKEVSRLKSLIGESGQELWSAENQRADRLETELGQVKRELDAAVEDIRKSCATCGRFEGGTCPVLAYKDYQTDCEHWEWRGAQKEE